MARVFRYRHFGVYVADARGEPHHLPHAHIKERGTLVCSISLITLEPLQPDKKLPAGLLDELEAHHEEMLAKWDQLNI